MLRPSTSFRSLRCVLLAAVCAALPQTAAAADLAGNSGYVFELTLNSSKSDRYLEYQGAVVLVEGDAAAAPRREYRWGGTSCSGYAPTDAQIDFLQQALVSRRALAVVPSYKNGSGGARCLVAFKLRGGPATGAP